ncbi:hypothetical protein GCM10028790_25610 [Micromonospora taraxaci]
MPITELVTWRVTPTYGPTRRSATVSSTSTAPLEKKTRKAARPLGNARPVTGAGEAGDAGGAVTSDGGELIVAMVRSEAGASGQYIER